jgi:hypothetical protein
VRRRGPALLASEMARVKSFVARTTCRRFGLRARLASDARPDAAGRDVAPMARTCDNPDELRVRGNFLYGTID